MACSLCRHRRERGTDHVNLILMHATLLMEKSNTRLHKVLEQTLFFNSSVGCGREVCCPRRYEGLILRLPEATRGRGIDLVQKVGILRPLPSSVKMPERQKSIWQNKNSRSLYEEGLARFISSVRWQIPTAPYFDTDQVTVKATTHKSFM